MSVGLTTPRVRAHRSQNAKAPEPLKPWRPWKKKTDGKSVTEKLLIPLPVPHPVHIAIAIHNRDSENPIPLDSELVWEILKSIEDCQGGDVMVSMRASTPLYANYIDSFDVPLIAGRAISCALSRCGNRI